MPTLSEPPLITWAQLLELLTNLMPGDIIEVEKIAEGEYMVATKTQTKKTKDDLIRERYTALVGRGITIPDAADKYKVPRTTISQWVYRNQDVNFVDKDSYPRKINEAEVAVCASIYHERKKMGTSGLRFFDEKGFLIQEIKHPNLSKKRRKKKPE